MGGLRAECRWVMLSMVEKIDELDSVLLTSCPSSGRASRAFFALFSSLTGSRDLRNLGG